MNLTIRINLDGDAFQPLNGDETARILRRLASVWTDAQLGPEDGERGEMRISDSNGNVCGSVIVEEA